VVMMPQTVKDVGISIFQKATNKAGTPAKCEDPGLDFGRP
jgi:hypothetical protein